MIDLAYQRDREIQEYPQKWKRLIQAWSDCQNNCLWLTYSANYLLHSSGVKWAIDPYSLFTRVGIGEQPDFANDFKPLQLIVLTHAHSDHLDLHLISSIAHLPIRWVIPEFMVNRILEVVNLDINKIIVPKIGEVLDFGNLQLTAFEGLHIRGENGVPAMGYLAEFDNKRWLFPGDTRSFNFDQLPAFGKLNGVLAHLWLGKASALENSPPLLDEFCHFFSCFHMEQMIITHLREFGRQPEDIWDMHHYQLMRSHFLQVAPKVKVKAAMIGESIALY
ncbi:MAG: MBL fold metallo-hydrolase [Anaerolineaceae bacterium]|nr:MBL fold metallo-hydrolase [Anaerolineaceae bacterium]